MLACDPRAGDARRCSVDSWKPQRRPVYADIEAVLRRHAALAAVVVLTAAPLVAIALLAPPPLILPTASLALLALAGALALFAWRSGARRHSTSITSWDVAGALAFIAFAAAILSQPENVLVAFAGAMTG
jgi:hypothetical protein